MHIPCISNKFRLYIQKIWIACTWYAMYMICIFFVYTNDIPKLNMEMLHEGQARGTLCDDNYDAAGSRFDPDRMWFMLPQLFFHSTLRPKGARGEATTVVTRTFWFSSAPLRNFA